MAVRDDFTAGEVLAAADLNDTFASKLDASSQKIVQVVSATTSTSVGITAATMTDSGLSATITPTSASNQIMVLVSQPYVIGAQSTAAEGSAQLLRDATVVAAYIGAANNSLGGQGGTNASGFHVASGVLSFSHIDSPATTSAITYKTQGRVRTTGSSRTLNFQEGSGNLSSIVLLEVTP